jgi:TolA-binding protein
MNQVRDPFDPAGLERLIEAAERDPAASEELDLLCDLVAAAERERTRLAVPPSRPPVRTLVDPVVLALAASLLFLVALGIWALRRGGREQERLAHLDPPRYVAVEVRDDGSPLVQAFKQAMEPYARGEWLAAREALAAFLREHPEHGPARFYLAAACEALGEHGRAETEYARVLDHPDVLLAAHARLRLAHLLLARGEDARARDELRALAEGGSELAPNARELLERLDAR